jgi:hypothetical protein
MAIFTEQEANACVINRCESVKLNDVHQYWVLSVTDEDNNLYEMEDRDCPGNADNAALKACIKAVILATEKQPLRQVISNDTKEDIIGNTIG